MGKGINGLSNKLYPVFQTIVNEIGNLSWIALVAMLCVGGALYIFGNEFGGQKVCKRAVQGFMLIQLAQMLV